MLSEKLVVEPSGYQAAYGKGNSSWDSGAVHGTPEEAVAEVIQHLVDGTSVDVYAHMTVNDRDLGADTRVKIGTIGSNDLKTKIGEAFNAITYVTDDTEDDRHNLSNLHRDPANPTRDDLIDLCERAIADQADWSDRDSASAHLQIGKAWALLKAGCEFALDAQQKHNSHWVTFRVEGFQYMENCHDEGYDYRDEESAYIPTNARLLEAGGKDWY